MRKLRAPFPFLSIYCKVFFAETAKLGNSGECPGQTAHRKHRCSKEHIYRGGSLESAGYLYPLSVFADDRLFPSCCSCSLAGACREQALDRGLRTGGRGEGSAGTDGREAPPKAGTSGGSAESPVAGRWRRAGRVPVVKTKTKR